MKNLKNISVFKVIILSIIGSYFNNVFLYFAIFIYLLITNHRQAITYIIIVLLIFILNQLKCDFVPIGIVESNKDSYYIVDKFIYKVKLITSDELKLGDLLVFNNKFSKNTYDSELKKNILFYGFEYKKVGSFSLKQLIYNKVLSFDSNTSSLLLKFLYNINNYDDLTYNIGYGLASYYLIRIIYKKNKVISLIVLILYSFLFVLQVKFYIILIDLLLSRLNLRNIDKLGIKILILYIINNCLFKNCSILIPLLINIYGILDINIDFKTYFSFIQSLLFGEVSIFGSLLYKIYIYIEICFILISFIVLLVPSFESVFLFLVNIFSNINDLNFSIRGAVSIISFILYVFFIKEFKINNSLLKYLLLIVLIISPFNNPFGHVSFIDVGQGDSILIKMPMNKGNVLIDTGSTYNYYKLKTYLYKQGIYSIDYLVITHNDSDHNGNVEALNEDFSIKNTIYEGIDFRLNNVLFKYYDLGTYDNDNDNSLVYGVSINDIDYLFTGDISSLAEKVFINRYGPIHFDVLKLSHHGSYTASSKYFIGNILPEYAIISTSGQYGHPAESTLETLNDYLVDYYVTKDDKNIEFYFIYGLNIIKSGIANFVIIR